MIVSWGTSALDDLFDINDCHFARESDFPERLLALVEVASGKIADNTEMYPEIGQDVRKVLLEPTAYLLFYVVRSNGVEIVRLVHSARNWITSF